MPSPVPSFARPPRQRSSAPAPRLSVFPPLRRSLSPALLLSVCLLLTACRRDAAPAATATTSAPAPAATKTVATPPPTAFKSADCRSCHEDIYTAWAGSHHAKANRPVDAALDADAFGTPREFTVHGIRYRVEWKDGKPHFTETQVDAAGSPTAAAIERYVADFALGHTPIRQYVVPIGGGRYQAAELTYDPGKNDFFNVFGDERRRRGEWGHWTGRGMNWNAMCAHCHMTDFKKNYDPVSDTYATTWREHGVGCAQCHGDLPASHLDPARKPAPGPRAGATAADLKRAQETCAPCHARNELLTGGLVPGAPYADHYRLTLPTETAIFWPDGQMRDDDFNYTGFLTSRMGGKAGVTCFDCHDPHSGKTRLAVQDNSLCMQCHGPSPRLNAPVIDPLAHSRHAAGSVGNQCVSCHMPTTTYMQRDPRHDHGFLKPDPLLTKELGIPNACNRRHTDKDVDWAIGHADAWYGKKLDSRQRARARASAAAQAGAPDAASKLLELIATEDIPAWRATLLLLTRPYAANDPRVSAAARAAAKHEDPLVRSAAAQILATIPAEVVNLRPLLNDSSRLVRLDAAWPLSAELAPGSPVRLELDRYLAATADQPAGRMRLGQDLFNRGRPAEAEAELRKATAWDPNSAGIHEALGIVLNENNKPAEAAASLWRAAQLEPTNATYSFNAALAFAGAGKLPDAELALRETLRRDPRQHRAAYNLGLLLAQTNRPVDALAALENAERLAPNVPDYPYARATVLWQRGDRAGAQAAARRTLELNPGHPQARALLQP